VKEIVRKYERGDKIYENPVDGSFILAGETTCWYCLKQEKCPYAYDAYNTNGDCLAEK